VTEIRIQVRERHFRVPDVCVTDAHLPREQIIRTPPLLCIEVLSPEDTFRKMRRRIEDFLAMGVPQVWIFDPRKRTATVCTLQNETAFETGILSLPGTALTLDIVEAFSTLDEV
jgi:Uma2 family endonuclease